jgi:hypothetical protein
MDSTDEFFNRVGTEAGRAGEAQSTNGMAPVPSYHTSKTPHDNGPTGRQWASDDDRFWRSSETFKALPAGCYRAAFADGLGPHVIRQRISTDDLLVLPDTESDSIAKEFSLFWTLKDKFAEHGFLHKRGYMLWGPPGSGKTSLLRQLSKKLVDDGNIIVFLEEPGLGRLVLRLIRDIEPERPIMAVLEDLDALTARHGEQEWLALLDGEALVDNIVYVATTNYPERLDKRFTDRPSRFDTISYIGMPSKEARRVYLKAKAPSLSEVEVELWVRRSDGYSVAHLKEMIVAVLCLGQDIDLVTKRLDKMRAKRLSSEDSPDRRSVGMIPLAAAE